MSIGIPRLLVLEDNDQDFETVKFACDEVGRPVRIQRYTRTEPLMDDIRSGRLFRPSLALIDLRMPGQSGMEALRLLKEVDQYSLVPSIVLSTTLNPVEVECCYKLRANAFHEKVLETPRMIETLAAVLRYWIDLVSPAPSAKYELHE